MSDVYTKIQSGINLKTLATSPAPSVLGDIQVNTGTSNLNYHNGTTAQPVLTDTNTASLQNKSIDAATNTLSNIVDANIKAAAGIAYSKLSLTGGIVNADVNASAAVAYSKLNLSGSIVNADVASGAAITYSKLSLTTSILNSDISASAAIAYSKLALSGSIVNADISNSAAIVYSKLSLTGSILNADLAGSITASKLVGTDIATVGTVTAGTWSANTIALNKGGTGQTTKTAAFDVLSPNTTKGDITVFNGTNNVRQAVGSDGQLIIADSSQANGIRYTNLQAGNKNYITYNNFENNATTGWSLGTIGTLTNGLPTGSPTFGSGASGNLSIATVSSGQLAGTYSLSYVSSAASTAGDMLATQAYTIDLEDQAKVLGYKFYYQAQSGAANCNFSGTSSNSFAVAVYDVTNSVFIPVVGAFNLVQSSGVGFASGTFQTNSNTASLRFIVYNANATSGAATLYLDDFSVGPQTSPMAPAMSDWKSYAPTIGGGGTLSNVSVWYKQVGDTLQVRGVYTLGTITGTTASITLPAGLAIDSSKFSSAVSTQSVGIGSNETTGAAGAYINGTGHAYFYDGSDTANIYIGYQTSTKAIQKLAASSLWTSGDVSTFQFSVPIAGWSSNSVCSSDTDTRVCATQYKNNGGQSITADVTDITFSTKSYDTHAVWSGTSFTAPVTGYYNLKGNIFFTAGIAPNIYAYVNTILNIRINADSGSATAASKHSFNGQVKLNAGDTLTIRSDTSGTLNASATEHWVAIDRLAGPAVITASEKIYLQYTGNGGTSITANVTNIDFSTKVVDSHGAWNGTTFTAPKPGFYNLSGAIRDGGSAVSVNFYIYINTIQTYVINGSSSGAVGLWTICGGTYLNAGDALTIRADASFTLGNSAVLHNISITSQG